MGRAFIWTLLLLLGVALTSLAADFPNVTQVPGTLLNGPIAPQQGRTAIVAWHGGRIISVPEPPGSQNGADLRVRIVNLSNLSSPQITTMPYQCGGFNSHGYFHYGPYLFIGGHETIPGNGIYRDSLFTTGTSGVFQERNMEGDAGLPIGTYSRSGAQSPWGARLYWSYGDVSGGAYLAVRRSLAEYTHDWNNGGAPTGPAVKSTIDLLGQTGVIGMPFIMGNILIYASDQTGTGVATYDISNPAAPVLLDVLKAGNPGGYWPEVYGHYIFFPRRDSEGGAGSQAGFMVVDFEDPTNLRIVASRNLPGSNQYVCFQDEFAFMNNYKIDMRTFDTVLTLPTNNTTLDASQFALPLGNLVVTGGYGSLGPGLAVWAHQAAPDTRGPFVAYHVPKTDQTGYSRQCPIVLSIPETLRTETIVNGTTLIVRPVGGSALPCWHSFGQNKLLTVTPMALLAADTTYEVVLTSGILDAAGNGLEPYSFRFSTGSGVAGGNRPPLATALSASPTPSTPGATVNFSATASDPDGNAIEYRFDFGDGSAKTAWSTFNSSSHAYAIARHYQVSVQVRDPSGALSSYSRKITVTTAPGGVAPRNSSSVALGASARRIWNVNPDSSTLTAVNADSLSKIWEQSTGARPRSVALASDSTLWVACENADRIDVLNSSTGALITSIGTGYGSAPIAVCASPDGASVYASCSGDGTFRRFSVSGRSQSGALPVGPSPRAIAITGSGSRALITRFISGEHEGSVYDVNLAGAMTLTRTIRLARHFVQDGSASGRGVPNYLAGITITPDNTRAWVVGKKDNTERGTFTSPNLALGQDSTVRAQLVVLDLSANNEATALRMDIDNSESPTAVAFSPLGDYGFIALQGNNQVAVVDYLEFMRADTAKGPMTRLATALAPQGLVFDAATHRLFTQNFMSRSLTTLEMGALLASGNLNVPSTPIATVATESLSAAVLHGKQIFYNAADPRMSAEGYISCATCHADGGHDGRTFDFTQRGEGFRNTTDLRGRFGTGHGAVHWTANFDEIQDFENDIRGAFGGTGFMTNADFTATSNALGTIKAGRSAALDDLAAYVTSLNAQSLPRSPLRQADGTKTPSALAGEAVFTRENCAACHIPAAAFTDRTRHNVGTFRASSGQRLGAALDGIDTPTLLGLHATAPYFHDGTARTLAEVFTIAGGDLRQAESGTVAGGALAGDTAWQDMKQWHGSGLVSLLNANEQVTFSGIDGGPGGTGMIEIRYAGNYGNGNLTLIVNGVSLPNVVLAQTPSEPNWMTNEWRAQRVLTVPFAAGTNNTVTLRRGNGGQVSLDDVLFSTPAMNTLAQAHRRALSATDLTDLTAYLMQLDVGDSPLPPALSSINATPNPATPGASVQFALNAGGAGPLRYDWRFGDGATSALNSPSHAYAATGTYASNVTVTDLLGQISAASLNVLVAAATQPGATDPNNPGGTGGGTAGGGTGGADPGTGGGDPGGIGGETPGDGVDGGGVTVPLAVTKLQGRMSPGAGRDQCVLAGAIPAMPAQFNPSGKSMTVNVGGASLTVLLDRFGRGKSANGNVSLKMKATVKNPLTKKREFAGGAVPFTAQLKNGSWDAIWLEKGIALPLDSKKSAVSVDVRIQFNANTYVATVPAFYTGRKDKAGSFKK